MKLIAIGVLLLAQAADGFTTFKVLSNGGVETFWLPKKLMKRFGIVPGMVVNKLLTMLPIAIAEILYKSSVTTWVCFGYGVFISVVAIRNWREYKK
ncbi:MAG: hypothetical protein H7831_06910 [Magnetococcus sp. WYHC-3]